MTLDGETLYRLGGVTGVGWTASLLGYASTVLGYGSSYVTRIVSDPQALLYTGAVLFLTTLGLDQLANQFAND